MTKLTKLALTQLNASLATENAALRKQVADLKVDLSIAHNVRAPAQHTMPQWQVDRAAAMAAARDMAMQTRMTIKV